MNSNYVLPITIVIAGALIAGAVFFVGKSGTSGTTPQDASSITARAFDASVDHVLGNPNAPVKIIEYFDLECGHCKIFHVTMHQIMDYYGEGGQVAWVTRHFPLAQIHSKAPKEAEAAECAAELGGNEGYWKFVDALFEVTPSNNGLNLEQLPQIAGQVGLDIPAFNECLNSGRHAQKIADSFEEAAAAGARGTPYVLVMVNGEVVEGGNLSGAQSYSDMRAIIDMVLAQIQLPAPETPSTAPAI